MPKSSSPQLLIQSAAATPTVLVIRTTRDSGSEVKGEDGEEAPRGAPQCEFHHGDGKIGWDRHQIYPDVEALHKSPVAHTRHPESPAAKSARQNFHEPLPEIDRSFLQPPTESVARRKSLLKR